MMKRNLKLISLYIAALLVLATVGCATKENKETNNSAAAETADLLYQATVSPNEQYAESDEDVVYYTVEVYQNEENDIIVSADSNSEFFDRMQYVILCNQKILEADIQVEWTTLMGNPKPAKDDQLAVAQVTISENGEIISQRKINFAGKAIEVNAKARCDGDGTKELDEMIWTD